VRYAETDAMGIVHHASYIVWLEAARVEWLKRIGLPYTHIEAMGLAFAVIEVHFTYRGAARFGDDVEVEVWLEELTSRTARYAYRVWNGESLLGEGYTRHLGQSATGKAMRIPDEVYRGLEAHLTRGSA
jgi:acyl-CoA thioester hydrolase